MGNKPSGNSKGLGGRLDRVIRGECSRQGISYPPPAISISKRALSSLMGGRDQKDLIAAARQLGFSASPSGSNLDFTHK